MFVCNIHIFYYFLSHHKTVKSRTFIFAETKHCDKYEWRQEVKNAAVLCESRTAVYSVCGEFPPAQPLMCCF